MKLPAGWYADDGPAGGYRLFVPTEDGVSHPVELVRTKNLGADVRTWVRGMTEVYADYGMKLSKAEMVYAVITANANRWKLTSPDRAVAVLYLMKELDRD